MSNSFTRRHYQDFVITTPTSAFYVARPLAWLITRLGWGPKHINYYGTTVRRIGKTKIEVTFDLPPTIKQLMHEAIAAGKQIRLFVL
ncbi:hypothetical protein HY346_00780 [Candidatus Microgenomates bacterium]|nr:hypothetical protein [Candidatus Microgenomates bacterium]